MKPKTFKALLQSIAHWRRMANGDESQYDAPVWSQCPLCTLFNSVTHTDNTACHGCPVFHRTGRVGCKRTPYESVANRWIELGHNEAAVDPVFQKRAQKEVEFLESLLPKTKQRKK